MPEMKYIVSASTTFGGKRGSVHYDIAIDRAYIVWDNSPMFFEQKYDSHDEALMVQKIINEYIRRNKYNHISTKIEKWFPFKR